MKTTLLILVFLVPFTLLGEENQKKKQNYKSGGIISLNNDTIQAQIKMESILKYQTEVKFIDGGGKRKSFKPGVINGFFIDNEGERTIFESRDDIRISVFPSKKGNFVLRISNDVYPLYYFVTTKMKNTGIESEMVEVPHYLVHMDYRWYHYNQDNFEDCALIFKDVRSLAKDIEKNKYDFNDFPEIVDRYCQAIKTKKR